MYRELGSDSSGFDGRPTSNEFAVDREFIWSIFAERLPRMATTRKIA